MRNDSSFDEMLAKEGKKNTRQRKAILDVLKSSRRPIAVEDIYLKLKESKVSISLSTVYRSLETLVSKKIVVKSNTINDNKARYELTREEHNHHLVCMKCSKMIPIEGCPLEQLEKNLQEDTDFMVTGHRLEIYGYCPQCKI